MSAFALLAAAPAAAPVHVGGEASLVLPDLSAADFLGINGRLLLTLGLLVCLAGVVFGLYVYQRLKSLPVHRSMRDVSELIYETCKTYLFTQMKFLAILWAFIGAIVVIYFGWLTHVVDPETQEVTRGMPPVKVLTILFFSLVGIAGSAGVAWFGIRVNTFANSRSAFASLRGKPYPTYAIPLSAGMSIGTMLISIELVIMLVILLFVPRDYAGRALSASRSGNRSGRRRCASPGESLRRLPTSAPTS